MKTTRFLAIFLFGMVVQSSLFAQTVNFLTAEKFHNYTQTDDSTAVDASNPWSFSAHVEASAGDLSGAAATLTIPSGTGSTTMTYNASGPKWSVTASFASQAALDAAYGNGDYSLTAYGQTVSPISLTGDVYPVAPIASLSGGTIVGGVLAWDPSQALTITISGASISHMAINVDGTGFNGSDEQFGGSTFSYTIDANSMLAGNNYNVELDFDNIVGGTLGTFGSGTGPMLNANYAGVYSATTTFAIQAIPEPSTYAAILGAVALAGVLLRRRRLQRA
ncbi:MAG TPA: PEP-CTERM sorting domain-containing protein [Lacunisphaera sp.]|nr:PEP-CTERM sorting domain-containing protein [Lacunisphaera sp.]